MAEKGSEPFQPEALLLAIVGGPVVGVFMGRPGEALGQAAETFVAATRKPLGGRPHVPSRVRVASAALAERLRQAAGPATEVVCAPTPELDELAKALSGAVQTGLGDSDDDEATYLVPGVSPQAMGAYFKATARFFRAAPWSRTPDDASVLSVTMERFGVRRGALTIMGHLGQEYGGLLFANFDDFVRFSQLNEARTRGGQQAVPPFFGLSFEPGAEMPPSMRKEVSKFRWEVAGPRAYPQISVVEEGKARPPEAQDLAKAEALALAVAQFIEREPELEKAWKLRQRVAHTFRVATSSGEVEVTVAAPHEDDPFGKPLGKGGLEVEHRGEDGRLDPGWAQAEINRIFQAFIASPEASELGAHVGYSHAVMMAAGQFLDVMVSGMAPRHVRAVLLGVFPEHINCDASKAEALVRELRAFFAFVGRHERLGNAEACARELTDELTDELWRRLDDPSLFGPAKAFLAAGRQAGFDTSTKEGIDAWIAHTNANTKKRPASKAKPKAAKPRGPAGARGKKR